MNTKKFVTPLTVGEIVALETIYKNHKSYAVCMRAHAILTSNKRFEINDISKIFDVHRNTISRWIDQWNERKVDGILTCEGQGRPRIFSEDEEDVIDLAIKNNPMSMKVVAVQVEKDTGKKASLTTLIRTAKNMGKSWKRIRKYLIESLTLMSMRLLVKTWLTLKSLIRVER